MKGLSVFLLVSSVVVTGGLRPGLLAESWEVVALRRGVASFSEFRELLSLPNDAHVPADIEHNVRWCESAFAKRGFATTRLETPTAPLLLAHRRVAAPQKTVLVYLQIDGQPVDAGRWTQPSPWQATLRERGATGRWQEIPFGRVLEKPDPNWRIFARSASDAKGPAAAFLAALDTIADLELEPSFDLKVVMDFEEELGSPQLPAAVDRYREALAADLLIIFDGPRHVSNLPTLTFGARGIADVTITTFGPRTPVHSGNYGNYTPNPAMRLAQLLASMKDDQGRVTIPGFYDGVELSEAEKRVLRQVPDDELEIRKFLGIAAPDAIGANFQESLQYPTLNIRGLDALYVGAEARTLIPATATAELDIRLVPASDPERLLRLVREHVVAQGYHLVTAAPTEEERLRFAKLASFEGRVSYRAFQTPFDSDVGRWLRRAMKRAFDKDPIQIRIAGGSIPISPFVVTLGVPAVIVPTVNADNNQHAEDENIRVGNYLDAVKTFVAILTEEL